jgi:DNA polymerase-3 subunit delta'
MLKRSSNLLQLTYRDGGLIGTQEYMSWSRIRGQEEAIAQLRAAWGQSRLGHAYALVGPPGVGKRLVAVELAKTLLCTGATAEFAACDRCPACAQVTAQTHPDYHVLRTPEGKHALPVEDMRQFCEALSRKPLRGGRVVGIVEDADDLNAESANAFLKTLEEPPPAALILLVSSGWEMLLPTIRSRCQVIRCAPLSSEHIAAILTDHGITDPQLRQQALRWCRGSAGRAMALADPQLCELRQKLWQGLANGQIEPDQWTQQCVACAEQAGKDSARQRERAELLLDLLVEGLRQAMQAAVLGAAVQGLEPCWVDWSRSQDIERGLDWLERTLQAYAHLERRVPLPLLFESLFDYFFRTALPIPK